jgi:hypothetical protein
MKLEPGKCDYPLPDCGMIERVLLDEGARENRGMIYPLMPITPASWTEMRGDPKMPPQYLARPVYFAWFGPDIGLKIWPAPEAAHDLRVQYFPHMKEV